MKDKLEAMNIWMREIFPGWKNKIGVLLTAVGPLLYLVGVTFDVEIVRQLLEAAPALWASVSAVGTIFARIGYTAKK